MKTLLKVLVDTLGKEIRIYQDFLKVVEQDRQLIIHSQAEELEKNVRIKDDFVEMLNEYEDKRMLITKEIGEKLGLSTQKIKLNQIADQLEEAEKKTLLQVKQKLENILVKVKYANRVNEMTVKGSLTYIRKTMEILTGHEEQDQGYSSTGQTSKITSGTGRISYVA